MRKYYQSLPQQQQGSTLVEVLVAVFLLTFGVLGLMAAQLRSVASISEAENRQIVALAAENLADGMQLNPSVERVGVNVVRRYPNYLNGDRPFKITNNHNLPTSLAGNGKKENISKSDIAKYQLDVFKHDLSQLPNTMDIQYAICLDSSINEPTYTAGRMNPNCSVSNLANAKTVIKVLWLVRPDKANTEPITFTYRLEVAQ